MKKSEDLLNKKETTGLRITLLFRVILLVASTTGHFFSHHSIGEVVRVSAVSSFFLLMSLSFFYLIRNGENLRFVGYTGLTADIFLLGFFPYNWYLSVGFYENVPATYLLKTGLPGITMSMLAVNSLALRPVYPMIIAGAFSSIWVFFLFLVFNDPRTIVTDSFLDNFFTPAILPGYYILSLVTVVGLAGMLAFLCYSYRRSIRDAVHFEVQNSQLGRYFSPGILNQIQELESVYLAKKSEVVILFSDIRSFTSFSESNSPEDVVAFLREYHSRMVEIIYEFGGTIDKFLGDGIMVTFGTPKPNPDDCNRAIKCALSMRNALKKFNEERSKLGFPNTEIGIGIHFGSVVSGNIGSESRLEYTVIGDSVNLASRIESQCKEFGRDILFSEIFANKIDDTYPKQMVGEVSIRGKKDPVKLYTIL